MFFRIWSKYGKIRTRKTPNRDTYHTVIILNLCLYVKISIILSISSFQIIMNPLTTWNVSVFGVILVRIFPHSCISPYSVRMLQNADQNNFRYGHFLRSVYENFLLILLWTNNKYSIHLDNTVTKIWRIFVSIRHHDKVLTLFLQNVFMVCKTPWKFVHKFQTTHL